METYFGDIEREVLRTYEIAERCRARGHDIEDHVEIPIAKDLPDRVEQLVGPEGIAKVIRGIEDDNRESLALKIAVHIAKTSRKSTEDAIDQAVRTGLAIVTEGILVAPLEGIASVYIGQNGDGTSYLGIKFSGPIRSAGGTGQAISVLLGDIVRRELGIGSYVPTDAEVQRYQEEIPLYKRSMNLQYLPSDSEIDTIVRNCPVCIDGDPTEKIEVSGQRDLPRVKTNRVRGGMCLVFSEGLALKSSKVQKHVHNLKIEGWEFLSDFKTGGAKKGKGVGPSDKYLKDLIVGRPIFSHPSRKGGFRLRYGRARTTGLAAIALNPATLAILGNYLAIGTQMKIERPGKAGAITSCDTIEGPHVILDDGSFLRVNDAERALEVKDRVAEIVDIGEVLIPFGEFVENNHPLMPGSYSIERWASELAESTSIEFLEAIEKAHGLSFNDSIELSKKQGLVLHPSHNLFWHDIDMGMLKVLADASSRSELRKGGLSFPDDEETREILIELGCPFTIEDSAITTEGYGDVLDSVLTFTRENDAEDGESVLEFLTRALGVTVPALAPTRIGGRMGRPEKAAPRQMKPPVHGLYPLGQHGGNQRLLSKAGKIGTIEIDSGARRCEKCGMISYKSRCCGQRTEILPVVRRKIDIDKSIRYARERLQMANTPPMKGVKGLISERKLPEPLEKGLLRARYGVFVNKDCTVRYECMDAPITHFRPSEIGTPYQRLLELGYSEDIHGRPLENDDQILELKVQDFLPPLDGGKYMVKVSHFVDGLLERFYDDKSFYDAKSPSDLVGHLIVGLAPHTSGGIVGRIIGFTDTQCGFAHPFYHAAKRRNCDGDADTFFLLMDGLLNFSKSYLPSSRGGQMDAPLVMPIRIDPEEIDKEALNVDIGWYYPAEFYRAADSNADPKEVAGIMNLYEGIVKAGGDPFKGVGFTHDTIDITLGPKTTRYTELGNMNEKLQAQMDLAKSIRAVDEDDLATRLIETHLLPDITGNLRTFSQQTFRCVKCGAKYRRVPLKGCCLKCDNRLMLTVHEGNVTKYITMARNIAETYDVSHYVKQRLDMLEISVGSMFAGNGSGAKGRKGKNGKAKKSAEECRSLEDFL